LTPDPTNAGAESGDPQSWNGYAYAGNNPINLTDPDGLDYHVCISAGPNNPDKQTCFDVHDDTDFARMLEHSPGVSVQGNEDNGTILAGDQQVGSYQHFGDFNSSFAQFARDAFTGFLDAFTSRNANTPGGASAKRVDTMVLGTVAPEGEAEEASVSILNKIQHIFGKSEHNMEFLVQQFGTKEAAYEALERATREQLLGKGFVDGQYKEIVSVGGKDVTVAGRVMSGTVKIGTAYVPSIKP
jgi:hypothetical protein